MRVLVVNGSPRKTGTIASLLRATVEGLGEEHEIEWLDVSDLTVRPCIGCMKCRPDAECILPEDDGHRFAEAIKRSDALVVGTPTYWGGMSGQLKVLLDRVVPALMGESPRGMPEPRHKGKPAIIVAACTTPWPFNVLMNQSRGAIRAVREVLKYAGYRPTGALELGGTKTRTEIPERALHRARGLGRRLK